MQGSSSMSGSSSFISPPSPSPRKSRPRPRPRAKTSTSFVRTLAPVMSRENSREDLAVPQDIAGHVRGLTMAEGDEGESSSQYLSRSLEPESFVALASPSSSRLPLPTGRKASKSISLHRPPLSTSSKRTMSYHSSKASGPSVPTPDLLSSPGEKYPRIGLKRRTSTPGMTRLQLEEEEEEQQMSQLQPASPIIEAAAYKGKGKAVETRARSTSTSIVAPPVYLETISAPTSAPLPRQSSPYRPQLHIPAQQSWSGGIYVTPASPEHEEEPPTQAAVSSGVSLLNHMYSLGESSFGRLTSWALPKRTANYHGHHPDSDSEKGYSEEELDSLDSTETATISTTRTSMDSNHVVHGKGAYWGLGEDDGDSGYFSLPPTPPEEKESLGLRPYFDGTDDIGLAGLPTPALSAHSLSQFKPRRKKRAKLQGGGEDAASRLGWLKHLASFGSGTKTGEVIRELGWTVGILVGSFVVTAGIVLWMIKGMPITQLKHLPTSTTDLQLLSAEIRSYMASGDAGWWHTVAVLTLVGCWKHAWSFPGAVVLNILVGSVLEPMPALGLLTLITATGSLGSYLLSRPLAPLIAVLFPKPLALVRAALAPGSVSTSTPEISLTTETDTVTPIQISSDPAAVPIGDASTSSPTRVWRRLLVMRAMGFVPWSGMNVACGVVGVDWRVFWLTTAAGSASWSYVTASVGNILSRLALPQTASIAEGNTLPGESLTSLLRDPVLIAKLVFLTLLTLLPVVVKRRTPVNPAAGVEDTREPESSTLVMNGNPALRHLASPTSPPMSPITQSLARFTPTPAAFDLLSFGRTAVRQGGKVVALAGRGAVDGMGKLVGVLKG